MNKPLLVALQFFAFSVQASWSAGVALGAHLGAVNVTAIFVSVQVVSLVIFGALADRLAPKGLLNLAGALFLAGAATLFFETPIWILISQALSGAAAGSMVVLFAAVNRHTAIEDRSYAMRRVVGFVWFGIAFGRVVSQLVLDNFGLSGFALLNLVLCVAIVMIVARLPDLPAPIRVTNVDRSKPISGTFLLALIASFLAATSGNVMQTRLHALLIIIMCVAAGTGAWVSRRRRFQRKNEAGILAASLIVASVACGTLAMSEHLGVLLPAIIVIGFMLAIGDACFQSIIGVVSRPSSRAMSIAVLMTVGTFGRLAGTLIATSTYSFVIATITSFLAAAFATILYPRVEAHLKA